MNTSFYVSLSIITGFLFWNSVDIFAQTDTMDTYQVVCQPKAILKAPPLKAGENGIWSVEAGNGVFEDITSPTTEVTGLYDQYNTFRWTVTNSTETSFQLFYVRYDHIYVYAGRDSVIGFSVTQLDASFTNYHGKWSLISGAGKLDGQNFPKATVRELSPGWNVFRWEVKNPETNCSDYDDIKIGYDNFEAIAGTKGDITRLCSDSVQLNANEPISGEGGWMILSGNGIFDDASQFDTWVYGLKQNEENRLRWQVTLNGLSRWDDISLYNNSFDIDGGDEMHTCLDSVQLNAEPAGTTYFHGVNETPCFGTWEILRGTATISKKDIHDERAWVRNLSPGLNTFRWTVRRGICSSFDTVNVITYLKPQADFIIDTIRKCKPATIQFTSTSFSPDSSELSYYWYFGDSVYDYHNNLVTKHIYNTTSAQKDYEVSLIARNEHGCEDTTYRTATIANCENTIIDDKTADLLVFPNPADMKIIISGPHHPVADNLKIKLLSTTGSVLTERVIRNSNHTNPKVELNVRNIPEGFYLLKFNASQYHMTKRLLILHR